MLSHLAGLPGLRFEDTLPGNTFERESLLATGADDQFVGHITSGVEVELSHY